MRIASLLPSATEILYAVGAGDDVVAVTHECDHPVAARDLPHVTSSAIDHDGQSCAAIDRHISQAVHSGSSIYRLDEALLRSLRPDLVVTQELCEVCAVSYRQVAGAARRLPGDVPVLSLEPRSLSDICDSVATVGAAAGRSDQGATLAADMRRRIEAVRTRARALRRPPVACIEWTEPLMGGGHWVPEMVTIAGGIDGLGTPGEPSGYVSWDDLVAAAPEVMVLMPCGFDLQATIGIARAVTGHPRFRELPCAATGAVVAVDGSAYFNRPGPRIVEGLEILDAVIRSRPGAALPPGARWLLT